MIISNNLCLKIAVIMVPYLQLVARLSGNLLGQLVHSEFISKLHRFCLMDFPRIRECIHVANARYVLLYISPRIVATGGSRKELINQFVSHATSRVICLFECLC